MKRYIIILLLITTHWIIPSPLLAEAGKGPENKYHDQIMSFLYSQFVFSEYEGVDRKKIRYAKRIVTDARGSLVIVSGRTEFIEKYAEVLYDLKDTGLSLFIYDHRGQGLSERLLENRHKGHVVDFEHYVDDMHNFVEKVIENTKKPLYIMAHSMGGCIATRYVQRYDGVSRLVLCSPMFRIDTGPLPWGMVGLFGKTFSNIGLRESYIWGGGVYDFEKKYSKNLVTNSPSRFQINKKLVEEKPQLALGSPTFGWLYQAYLGINNTESHLGKIDIPVLLLKAGADEVVEPEIQGNFCRAMSNCEIISYPNAKHELLMEKDTIRNDVLLQITTFFSST